ncbi:phosphohistidine phosphatase SixA [Photobacterium sanctipauli]|uniref:Phosphohistidine phosphatase SixA n=1 Tax=Photobacterium sanctipauli TaxID=1342794 RepID=A0A2T3NRH6_9GAMM|nr:phosphohistidine phosphatase SixA [Photobacterium sanctipauli]PSW18827.1 phosphohistidine phosphatase SixA [Photobacterium sanctipauli]
MRIYIMRHGEAHNFAPSDAERPLTPRGEALSSQMAVQLASQLGSDLDMVWVSPYLRAQQTWQSMAGHLPEPKRLMTLDDITPYGDADSVAAYIKAVVSLERPETLLVVSHLPLVGYLTAELVAGLQPPMFITSSIAAIEYDPDTEASELLWQANPEG